MAYSSAHPESESNQSLMIPSDRFLDLISPILNLSRGRHIAFYLREQYGFSPADVLAETLVPHVRPHFIIIIIISHPPIPPHTSLHFTIAYTDYSIAHD